MERYSDSHPTPEELISILGPRWAICKNTVTNRAMYGNCITRKTFKDVSAQIMQQRKTAHEELLASHERLRVVLETMVKNECDYMRINNLGDPEQQHEIIQAREALKLTPDMGG